MKLPSLSALLGIAAAGTIGYLVGSGQSQAPPVPIVTMDHVQISQIHPAALYVRTLAGDEKRFLIDPLDPNWADTLVAHPSKRWHLELEASSCPDRYTLRTLVSD